MQVCCVVDTFQHNRKSDTKRRELNTKRCLISYFNNGFCTTWGYA